MVSLSPHQKEFGSQWCHMIVMGGTPSLALSERSLHPIYVGTRLRSEYSAPKINIFWSSSKSFSHLFANSVIIFHYVAQKRLRIQEYININLIDFKLKFISSLPSLYANCEPNIKLIYDRKDHSLETMPLEECVHRSDAKDNSQFLAQQTSDD